MYQNNRSRRVSYRLAQRPDPNPSAFPGDDLQLRIKGGAPVDAVFKKRLNGVPVFGRIQIDPLLNAWCRTRRQIMNGKHLLGPRQAVIGQLDLPGPLPTDTGSRCEQALGLEQCLLSLPLHGDVFRDTYAPYGLPAGIAQRGHAGPEPDDARASGHKPYFRNVAFALAFIQFAHFITVFSLIIRVNQGVDLHAIERLCRVPKHLAVSSVDFKITTFEVRNTHACSSIGENIP